MTAVGRRERRDDLRAVRIFHAMFVVVVVAVNLFPHRRVKIISAMHRCHRSCSFHTWVCLRRGPMGRECACCHMHPRVGATDINIFGTHLHIDSRRCTWLMDGVRYRHFPIGPKTAPERSSDERWWSILGHDRKLRDGYCAGFEETDPYGCRNYAICIQCCSDR